MRCFLSLIPTESPSNNGALIDSRLKLSL
jgi:hypothetical protein